eukprot:1136500-Pelagomonas_calceolata.AAC.3
MRELLKEVGKQRIPHNTSGTVQLFQQIQKRSNLKGLNWSSFQPHHLFYYDDGSKVPAMSDGACHALFLSGLACENDGTIVEMGTWLGASSRCLAAGLKIAGCSVDYKVLDRFQHSQLSKLAGTRYAHIKPHSVNMLDIWTETVTSIYPAQPIVVENLDNLKRTGLNLFWRRYRVQMFVIDSAKSVSSLRRQAHTVWENLVSGSVLHLMDFIKTDQVAFVASLLIPFGYLKVLHVPFGTAAWVFSVEKALPRSLFSEFLNRTHSCRYAASGFEALFDAVHEQARLYCPDSRALKFMLNALSFRKKGFLTNCRL